MVAKITTAEVLSAQIHPVAAHQRADLAQQGVRAALQGGRVEPVGKPCGLLHGHTQALELVAKPTRGGPSQRVGEIPEQLVHPFHNLEGGEHRVAYLRRRIPVTSAEVPLDDTLAGPETVIDGAAREATVTKLGVDRTAEVRCQVGTRAVRRLVEREVRRGREGRYDAAQAGAGGAVRAQVAATVPMRVRRVAHAWTATPFSIRPSTSSMPQAVSASLVWIPASTGGGEERVAVVREKRGAGAG
jgi:hypothetical protein